MKASVATIYYHQPLLLEITRTFHVSPSRGGAIAVATQVGFPAELFACVPLADVVGRRKLSVRPAPCLAPLVVGIS